MSFLSRAQKAAIKARAGSESSTVLAVQFGISRARVRQIAQEDPDTWKDFEERQLSGHTWRPKGLSSEQVAEILASPECHAYLARRFGVSLYQIQRLRHSRGIVVQRGRPRSRAR